MKRRDSIFFRLTAAFIGFGLLPILAATLILYAAFSGNMEEVVLRDFSNLVKYAGENISRTLEEYSSLTGDIYYQDVDDGVMLAEYLKNSEVGERERSLTLNMVMQNILDQDSKIRTAFFVDRQGRINYATKNTQKVLDEGQWTEAMEDLRDLSNGIRIAVSHTDSYFPGSESQVMTFACEFNDITSYSTARDSLGTLYLDLDFSVISQMAEDVSLNEEGIFRIMDGERVCIYSSDSREIGEEPENVPDAGFTGGESLKYIRERGNYFVYFKIPGTAWTAEVQVSEAAVMKNIQAVQIYVGIFLLVSVCALVLVYRYYLKRLRHPMGRLIRGMNEIQSGNLKARVETGRMDEIGSLAAGLNRMAGELDEYIQRVYVSELRQRETELDMLKTQIQPHYLYNTLEVIRMHAVTNDDPETAEMVESLSRQLRYLIGKTGDLVTLHQEVGNITEYFRLLKIRYEGRFSLETDIPEEAEDLYIMKLSLQPVVENAVKHGLIPKSGEGIVQISASVQENFLEVTVMDDGVGMDENTLRNLQQSLDSDEDPRYSDGRTHIGIRNTAERLRKSYGEEYGIRITGVRGFGTVVSLRYPLIREGRTEKQEKI